ncbi:MAG TPA: hypothetical protein ENN07_03715 [candidate division Zixibacteria bacterium]|nr:hypothetical protein [candidate division Zixibacteria bacterium]
MDKTGDPSKTIRIALIISLAGTLCTAIALIIMIAMPQRKPMSLDEARSYAAKLANAELYEQAVDEYERIFAEYRLSDRDAGSILYQVGTISGEKLHQPARAMAAFLKFQELYPMHPLIDDVNRKAVAQLDRMGKSRQAQSLLRRSVSLGKPADEADDPSRIVAKIGDRVITAEEVESALEELPREVSAQLGDAVGKQRFLQEYIGQQLIYNAAIRAGYDQRPEILDQLESAQMNIIVAAFFKERIADRVQISSSDIEVYYNMNKANFGDRPLEEVRSQVEQKLRYQKMAELQGKIFEELMETENVQLFPENLSKPEE